MKSIEEFSELGDLFSLRFSIIIIILSKAWLAIFDGILIKFYLRFVACQSIWDSLTNLCPLNCLLYARQHKNEWVNLEKR